MGQKSCGSGLLWIYSSLASVDPLLWSVLKWICTLWIFPAVDLFCCVSVLLRICPIVDLKGCGVFCCGPTPVWISAVDLFYCVSIRCGSVLLWIYSAAYIFCSRYFLLLISAAELSLYESSLLLICSAVGLFCGGSVFAIL